MGGAGRRDRGGTARDPGRRQGDQVLYLDLQPRLPVVCSGPGRRRGLAHLRGERGDRSDQRPDSLRGSQRPAAGTVREVPGRGLDPNQPPGPAASRPLQGEHPDRRVAAHRRERLWRGRHHVGHGPQTAACPRAHTGGRGQRPLVFRVGRARGGDGHRSRGRSDDFPALVRRRRPHPVCVRQPRPGHLGVRVNRHRDVGDDGAGHRPQGRCLRYHRTSKDGPSAGGRVRVRPSLLEGPRRLPSRRPGAHCRRGEGGVRRALPLTGRPEMDRAVREGRRAQDVLPVRTGHGGARVPVL